MLHLCLSNNWWTQAVCTVCIALFLKEIEFLLRVSFFTQRRIKNATPKNTGNVSLFVLSQRVYLYWNKSLVFGCFSTSQFGMLWYLSNSFWESQLCWKRKLCYLLPFSLCFCFFPLDLVFLHVCVNWVQWQNLHHNFLI